jgi:hypothetical protein
VSEEKCPRCGAVAWQPAMTTARKRVLMTVAEAGVVGSGLAAVMWSNWFLTSAALFGVFLLAVVLRSRQQLCADCGWARAVRTQPPPA